MGSSRGPRASPDLARPLPLCGRGSTLSRTRPAPPSTVNIRVCGRPRTRKDNGSHSFGGRKHISRVTSAPDEPGTAPRCFPSAWVTAFSACSASLTVARHVLEKGGSGDPHGSEMSSSGWCSTRSDEPAAQYGSSLDSPLEEAVTSELVSKPQNSLLAGKKQGIFTVWPCEATK